MLPAMASPKMTDAIKRQTSTAVIRLEAFTKQLLGLFAEIGVPESDWEARLANIWACVVGTMQEEVEEEKRRVRTLTETIEVTGRQLLALASQLGREVEEPDENLSLLQLNRQLQQRLQQLQDAKERLVAEMRVLREEESELCGQLDLPPVQLESEVPREADFREVRDHLAMLRAERQRRAAALTALRQRLFPLLEALERSAESELERQAVWVAEEADFPLTKENLDQLERWVLRLEAEEAKNKTEAESLRTRLTQLWTRLEVPEDRRVSVLASCTGHKPSTLRQLREQVEAMEELKRQNVQKFVMALRREIAEMWEKCYYAEEQRAAFTPFYDNTFTESLLERHEAEMERLRRYYETNRVLIRDVDEHQRLWAKMIELEERASDPTRFSNRGGQLLLEEKERKKIERRLPKVEADLQQLIQRWEQQHGTVFLVHGRDFAAYIEQQKLDYKERKEQERAERHNQKQKQLEHETMFGARAATPAKRRGAAGGERPSPSKQRRLESTRLGAPLSAASPGLGRTLRTPLSVYNGQTAANRNTSMARTAPGKLSARSVSVASDMSYGDFTRGLRRLQAGGGGSPALRAAARSRRRSQRLGGLPPAVVTPRTPRGAAPATATAAKSPRPPATPRSTTTAARRARLGVPRMM